jgi:flagellar motor protein MotB
MRLNDFITEDSNQFGPGTDLMISLLAVLLIISLVIGHMYDNQRKQSESLAASFRQEKGKSEALEKSLKKKEEEKAKGGNFKLASIYFSAGDFAVYPVTKLTDEARTRSMIQSIAQEYTLSQADLPFIFIIGHSNKIDDPRAIDKSYGARLQRNWEYAGRRAGIVASLLQEYLADEQKEKIVVVSSGEFDLRDPGDPISQENAWVEVVFGKEWKIPSKAEVRGNQ